MRTFPPGLPEGYFFTFKYPIDWVLCFSWVLFQGLQKWGRSALWADRPDRRSMPGCKHWAGWHVRSRCRPAHARFVGSSGICSWVVPKRGHECSSLQVSPSLRPMADEQAPKREAPRGGANRPSKKRWRAWEHWGLVTASGRLAPQAGLATCATARVGNG